MLFNLNYFIFFLYRLQFESCANLCVYVRKFKCVTKHVIFSSFICNKYCMNYSFRLLYYSTSFTFYSNCRDKKSPMIQYVLLLLFLFIPLFCTQYLFLSIILCLLNFFSHFKCSNHFT